jgi:hypothetical protein
VVHKRRSEIGLANIKGKLDAVSTVEIATMAMLRGLTVPNADDAVT